jgi:thioester reductase-like protein
MGTFLTGVTGYLGSYLAAGLLREGEELRVLVRASDADEAKRRLWKSFQLHFDFSRFRELLDGRIHVHVGDLTVPSLGLSPDEHQRVAREIDSVVHCAASLNRRSERSCVNVNLRGTLAVIQLARAAQSDHGLRRFSQISTVAVAGERRHETVTEDEAIDWTRRDYDPYGRTKKFAEHMVRELLPDVPITIFRPSIVLGDSRRPETTQFDMVRAFSFLAGLRILPLRASDRIDIVPADWVADAVVALHRQEAPAHRTYHLSAGRLSETYEQITDALADEVEGRRPTYVPPLATPFRALVGLLARGGRGRVRREAALLEVFSPYLEYDTVFDSSRAVAELGREPARFTSYCAPLLRFARRNRFAYPYRDWPAEASAAEPIRGGPRPGAPSPTGSPTP